MFISSANVKTYFYIKINTDLVNANTYILIFMFYYLYIIIHNNNNNNINMCLVDFIFFLNSVLLLVLAGFRVKCYIDNY